MSGSVQDRLIKLLLDQRKPGDISDVAALSRMLSSEGLEAGVDWDEFQEALGYSSVQLLAFMNGINAEFGTSLDADSFATIKGPAELIALLQ